MLAAITHEHVVVFRFQTARIEWMRVTLTQYRYLCIPLATMTHGICLGMCMHSNNTMEKLINIIMNYRIRHVVLADVVASVS